MDKRLAIAIVIVLVLTVAGLVGASALKSKSVGGVKTEFVGK